MRTPEEIERDFIMLLGSMRFPVEYKYKLLREFRRSLGEVGVKA